MTDDAPDNPLPSEQAMFKVVVGVGLALLPVLVVSAIAGPVAGRQTTGADSTTSTLVGWYSKPRKKP